MLEIHGLRDLAELDRGVVEFLFKRGLEEIWADLMARAMVKTVRTLDVKLAFTPKAKTNGDLMSVEMTVEVNGKRPVLRTSAYSVRPDGKGGMVVLPGVDDPGQEQMDFDKVQDKKGEKK